MNSRPLQILMVVFLLMQASCSSKLSDANPEVPYDVDLPRDKVIDAIFILCEKEEIPIAARTNPTNKEELDIETGQTLTGNDTRWVEVRQLESMRIISSENGKATQVWLSTVRVSKGRWDGEDEWTRDVVPPSEKDIVHSKIRSALLHLTAHPTTENSRS